MGTAHVTTFLQMMEIITKMELAREMEMMGMIIVFASDVAINQCLQCPSSVVARGKLNVRHTVYRHLFNLAWLEVKWK